MILSELFTKSGQELTLSDIKDKTQLAHKLHLNPEDLNSFKDEEILDILKNLGFNDFSKLKNIDKSELEKGIKHELEHSKSKLVAQLIALDHLIHDPKYYLKLNLIDKD